MTETTNQKSNSESVGRFVENLAEYLQYNLDERKTHLEVPAELCAKSVPEAAAGVRTQVQPAAPVRAVAPAAEPSTEIVKEREIVTVQGDAEVESVLNAVAGEVAVCGKCSLHKTRTKTVPGQGCPRPEIMFIGEAPGADEDLQGLAFVGRAGQLLTKMIAAMGYAREEVFIGNILKCRPPDNRQPLPEEMDTCIPYLKRQIKALKPKVIVALGATAVKGLLNPTVGITKLRGTWQTFEGIDLMPTYHPAYLLRNPPAKKEVWEDLQAVLKKLGKTPPPAKKE